MTNFDPTLLAASGQIIEGRRHCQQALPKLDTASFVGAPTNHLGTPAQTNSHGCGFYMGYFGLSGF